MFAEDENSSPGQGLQLYSTLTLNTQNGSRHIELLFGDITCLKEEVDVVMVSAFSGNLYMAMDTLSL